MHGHNARVRKRSLKISKLLEGGDVRWLSGCSVAAGGVQWLPGVFGGCLSFSEGFSNSLATNS
jgi:hypothetical protein